MSRRCNICNLILFLLITLVISPPPLILGEPQVPCLFIFGDSLVDNGNNNYLRTSAKANYWPYGIDFPAGPTGRFTNGRNVADIIAELLGFEQSIPPFSDATNEDILRGLNYASGGSGIFDETGANYGEVISLSKQLQNHEITISKVSKLLGDKRAAETYLNSCIYYAGMGNNDYLANYFPKFYSSATQYTPNQFAALLITQYSHQLRKLYDYGARKVAVFGVGKLGCIPQQLVAYGATDGSHCFETSNDVVRFFNEYLRLLIIDLNIGLPNAKFVYSSSNNASSYGNIKILSEACCPTSENGESCGEGSVPCDNRDDYYFWDEFHPTEAANLIAANNVYYTHMLPLIATPVDVS